LEIMAFDWFKKMGVDYRDLTIRYFDTTPDSATAFMSGAIDILTTIEPYGTIIARDKPGVEVLSDGTDVYGTPHYSDCILGVRAARITAAVINEQLMPTRERGLGEKRPKGVGDKRSVNAHDRATLAGEFIRQREAIEDRTGHGPLRRGANNYPIRITEGLMRPRRSTFPLSGVPVPSAPPCPPGSMC